MYELGWAEMGRPREHQGAGAGAYAFIVGFHHHAGQGDTRTLRNLGGEVLGPISNSQMRKLSLREVKLPKVTAHSSECYNWVEQLCSLCQPHGAGSHRAS